MRPRPGSSTGIGVSSANSFCDANTCSASLALQRLKPPAGAADPVGKGRAVDLDALPGEDLALPVERQVIAVFGDQDVGEQGGGRQALGDRPLRSRRLVDGPAGPAAIARPADADDPQAAPEHGRASR